MKILLCFCCWFLSLGCTAQFLCTPTGDSGSGYPAMTASGLGIESPDCVHGDFGPHVTQSYDDLLDRNVFVFHSHIEEDNDRCEVFDRVRMEVKGGPNTSEILQHPLNSETYYRWKFRLPADFVGASSFCHLFQNKIKGGSDSGFPIITFTARTEVLRVIHNGGDTGNNLGTLAEADLGLFRGKWVEAYVYQRHAENGAIDVQIRDMASGDTILSYQNNDIDLWREGGDYDRPKWGIYRRKADGLKDETVRFTDFCVSETEAGLCPADTNLIVDVTPPSPPTGLVADNVMIDELTLNWEAATDNVGVNAYEVWQDGTLVWSGPETGTTLSGLTGGTTYSFRVTALDGSNNRSESSEALEVTTDPATALPDPPGLLFPADGAEEVSVEALLRWSAGENTDSFRIYLGPDEDPPAVATQTAGQFTPELTENTTYYWRIGSLNANGETPGPRWSFTTGTANADAPWLVYRGNARPELAVDFFELNTEPENPNVDEVVADPIVPSNNLYRFYYDGDENFRWRYRFTEADSSITVTARFRAISEGVNGVCYFEIRGFGWREKIRINQSTLKMERSSPVVERDLPFDPAAAFHLIRITMKGRQTTVYLDEDPVPFATGTSGDDDSNLFFEWGKSGGQPYGAVIDWIGIVLNQDFAPDEGPPIPGDLVLSNNADLDSILVNGLPIAGFHPDSLVYDIALADNTLPNVEPFVSARWSDAVVQLPDVVPNTSATVTVTAQDGISQSIYTLNFVAPSRVSEPAWGREVRVFPNPSPGRVALRLPDLPGARGVVKVLTSSGRTVKRYRLQSRMQLDLSDLPGGLYLLRIAVEGEPVLHRKLRID